MLFMHHWPIHSPESETGKPLPVGIYEVRCQGKNRCVLPDAVKNKQTDKPIWLFYDASKWRAVVVFDQKEFSAEFPNLLLTQINIDKQWKMTFPKSFLDLHSITLNKWAPIRFVSLLWRNGESILEIYFADASYQKNVVEFQRSMAQKIADLLTTPPSPHTLPTA